MPLKAARGDRKLEANGCRGASWSEQLDGKELRGALGSAIGTKRTPVFWTSSAQCGMLISKGCVNPVVPL